MIYDIRTTELARQTLCILTDVSTQIWEENIERERNYELTEPYDVMHHLGIKRVNGAYQDYQLKYYLDFLDSKKPLTKEEIYYYTDKYQKLCRLPYNP